uniref:Uncharacterized protein n=1 Tax=Arundo donax TaxID=35708 RepID=A0A0A9H4E6_ARUDO
MCNRSKSEAGTVPIPVLGNRFPFCSGNEPPECRRRCSHVPCFAKLLPVSGPNLGHRLAVSPKGSRKGRHRHRHQHHQAAPSMQMCTVQTCAGACVCLPCCRTKMTRSQLTSSGWSLDCDL